jgi:glycosyltransferase involved in cell wall biosynthesis
MKPLRLLAIIEADTVTGPAKNLLQFGSLARSAAYDPPVELSIVVFRRSGTGGVFAEAAERAGLPLHAIEESGRFDRAVLSRLSSLARELRPGVIQSHAVKSHFLVRQAGLDRLAPWIAFHHGYTWPTLTARVYNQLDRWSLRAASRVLTVSIPFRNELVRNGVRAGRIEIVHNAVDADWASPTRQAETPAALRSRLGIPPSRKVVLIVGRLSREKDHRSLLDAIHRLPPRLDPHLLIVGDGPEREAIQTRIRALGMDGAVTLAGQTPSAEPFYSIADVAVLSSRSEGSPNALLEAMAAQVPVVSTRVGGVPEIVADGESALLVAPGDASAMADALGALLSSPELARKIAGRARELIAARHTPDARVRRLVGIYRGVLNGPENVA